MCHRTRGEWMNEKSRHTNVIGGQSQVKSSPTPVGEPNVRAEAEKKICMYIPMFTWSRNVGKSEAKHPIEPHFSQHFPSCPKLPHVGSCIPVLIMNKWHALQTCVTTHILHHTIQNMTVLFFAMFPACVHIQTFLYTQCSKTWCFSKLILINQTWYIMPKCDATNKLPCLSVTLCLHAFR